MTVLWQLSRQLHSEIGEDRERRQFFVLLVLLAGSLCLTLIALLIVLIKLAQGASPAEGMPIGALLVTLALFLTLFLITRYSYFRIASYGIVILYFILASYAAAAFGTLFIQAWLLYTLVVVMAFTLIGIKAGLITSILTSLTIAILDYLHTIQAIQPNLHWTTRPAGTSLVTSIFLFMTIALLSWLATREIERSLKRVLDSEAALKRERDSLEVKVAERTKELQQTQAERTAQLYRFAAFGRIASGILHDLINPLTTVSLSLEELKTRRRQSPDLERAIEGTDRMQRFIKSLRQQLQDHEEKRLFLLTDEIEQAIDILAYKAKKRNVRVVTDVAQDITISGSPIKFQQVITNLISNAIDAYSGMPAKDKRFVTIKAQTQRTTVLLTVHDTGCGIPKESLTTIFEPFYTTKRAEAGTGIGLSIAKEFIESDFKGSIEVHSNPKDGTTFTVILPGKRGSESSKD